jgi:hypothetical protein
MGHALRACACACACLVLALTSHVRVVGQPSASAPSDRLVMPPDFPPADQRIWTLQEKGLTAKLAERAITEAPAAPETLDLLQRAGRVDDAVKVFQRIVDDRPASLERAIKFVPALSSDATRNAFSTHADTLRELVAKAKTRLPELPREDAARAARGLLTVEGNLTRLERGGWAQRLRAFVKEWAGTEAALLTEVDLIRADPLTPATLEALGRR